MECEPEGFLVNGACVKGHQVSNIKVKRGLLLHSGGLETLRRGGKGSCHVHSHTEDLSLGEEEGKERRRRRMKRRKPRGHVFSLFLFFVLGQH